MCSYTYLYNAHMCILYIQEYIAAAASCKYTRKCFEIVDEKEEIRGEYL